MACKQEICIFDMIEWHRREKAAAAAAAAISARAAAASAASVATKLAIQYQALRQLCQVTKRQWQQRPVVAYRLQVYPVDAVIPTLRGVTCRVLR